MVALEDGKLAAVDVTSRPGARRCVHEGRYDAQQRQQPPRRSPQSNAPRPLHPNPAKRLAGLPAIPILQPAMICGTPPAASLHS